MIEVRKKVILFIISLIILSSLSLTSLACRPDADIFSSPDSLGSVSKNGQLKKINQVEKNKIMVVFFDISASTTAYRAEYLEDFGEVFLPLLNYGDKIIVSEITKDSIQEARILVNQVLPNFSPDLAKYSLVEKDNFLVERALKEEAKRQKGDFMKRNDLNAIRKETLDKVANSILSSQARLTDIFSSFKLAERMFSANNFQEKLLIIFSDMIEDSSFFNFEKEEFASRRIQEIINSEKLRSGLPNLSGVKVYVVGARATKGGISRFYKVKNFWSEYFQATGAQLIDYGRRAIERE